MNQLQIFENNEFGKLTTMLIDSKPYFVANEVAKGLGCKRPADAITQHCKGAVKHRYLTEGGMQEVKVISEGDVWRLIIRSKLPQAENEVKERTIGNPDGTVRITKTTKVTGKGQTYFINRFIGQKVS